MAIVPFSYMKNIDHLTPEEREHYILCACGDFVDMRNLSEVFKHLHGKDIPEPEWSVSVKVGEPAAYTRTRKKIDLN